MVTSRQNSAAFQLPTRTHSKPAAAESSLSRLALADRIATLPHIRAVENACPTVPCSVNVYLANEAVVRRKQKPARLLCEISTDGIRVHGLSSRDRHQVLSHGWGVLDHDRVLVFLPRDESETEVCWRIVQRAYDSVVDLTTRSSSLRIPTAGALPRFSRTTLQ